MQCGVWCVEIQSCSDNNTTTTSGIPEPKWFSCMCNKVLVNQCKLVVFEISAHYCGFLDEKPCAAEIRKALVS